MSEEFFERLKGKAWDHSDNWEPKDYPHPVLPLIGLGISATIEALKEMIVGDMMKGKLSIGRNTTFIDAESENWLSETWAYDELGVDGEEVIVMVMRLLKP